MTLIVPHINPRRTVLLTRAAAIPAPPNLLPGAKVVVLHPRLKQWIMAGGLVRDGAPVAPAKTAP